MSEKASGGARVENPRGGRRKPAGSLLGGSRGWWRYEGSRVEVEGPQVRDLAVAERPVFGEPDFVTADRAGGQQRCDIVAVARNADQSHGGEIDHRRQRREHTGPDRLGSTMNPTPRHRRGHVAFETVAGW